MAKEKLKHIKKYVVEMDVKCKLNKKDTNDLLLNVLKDYFLEGTIKKVKAVEMTKDEIEDWIDFDEEDED
jgi:uncharacterized protein (UPF0128 family)